MANAVAPRTSELTLEQAPLVSLAVTLARRVLTHPTTLKTAVIATVAILAYFATRTKKSLKGRTIVLTGAATGLGNAQAFELARQGARVLALDINKEQLDKTVAEVRAKYPQAQIFSYEINLANREAIYALAERVQREHGFVWGLINNAGIISGAPLLETPDKKIELTMAVNTLAHFWTIKAFLPAMIERNDGHIVAISSAAGFFGSARMTDYCASKFAVRGLMDSLRFELGAMGKTGVKTTLVAPAAVSTALFRGFSFGPSMSPEYAASRIIEAMRGNVAMTFLPHLPLVVGNISQNVFPTAVFDFFMIPTRSQMSKWDSSHANKLFEKMEKSQ